MKARPSLRIVVLNTVLITLAAVLFTTAVPAQTQDPMFALQRGYRTGYSDGYMAGYRDTIDSVARNYTRHADYTKADRAFHKDYGLIDDYRDGYKQGFEAGYETGYERRSFEATLPAGLKRRGVIVGDRSQMIAATDQEKKDIVTQTEPANDPQTAAVVTEPVVYQAQSNAIILIPRDTELILELQNDISTETSREGDKFTARISAPSELAGATVEGRVSKIHKPGRIKRRSEMLLSFDRIILSDSRWSNFSATLTEVLAVKGDNIRRVDNEGTAVGQSSLKGDLVKVGGSTGAGAVIGGVVGGPVGVAVGAGVGAAFGVGAVVIERGKHVRLSRNQQIRIRTAYETQIR